MFWVVPVMAFVEDDESVDEPVCTVFPLYDDAVGVTCAGSL